MKYDSDIPNGHPAHASSSVDAFTLVEVAIALAIITFALIAVFSLLPVGLNSLKHASDEAAAASALRTLSTEVLCAPVTTNVDGSLAQHLADIEAISWTIGGPLSDPALIALDAGGRAGAPSADQTQVAHIEVVPPPNVRSAGRAHIRIAWPATAIWTSSGWTNAAGSLESTVYFVPST